VSSVPTGIAEVNFVTSHMDAIAVSWAFWDSNLVFGDATYELALARPYPRALAGEIDGFSFEPATGLFELNYTADGGTTDVYLGSYVYPTRNVTAAPEVNVTDVGDGIRVTAPTGTRVELVVRP
jgi:hypothetical protein